VKELLAGNEMSRNDFVGICYQATTGEDTEDLVCAVVRSYVCRLSGTV
jgi:hypothetical protein